MKPQPKSDLPGAVAVFLVALPLCVGLAQACGFPAVSGLVAGILGGVLVGMLSGSHLAITGPAAGLVPVVLMGWVHLKSLGAILCATCLAGVLQILLGWARAGAVTRIFPASVIRGMMTAIGLIMVLEQMPHVLGFDQAAFGVEELETVTAGAVEWVPASIGLLCLAVVGLWEWRLHRRFPLIPGALIAALLGLGCQWGLTLMAPEWALNESHRVHIPPQWWTVQPQPDWGALQNPATYWIALTLALVASLETLVALEVIDRLDTRHRVAPANRELLAQGTGNLLSGLLGGLPLTVVLARSTVNLRAGTQTRWAAIGQGALLALALLLFVPQLNMLPLSALAAVLVVVGISLIRVQSIRELLAKGPTQVVPFAVTVLGVLTLDLMWGILLGMATSFSFVIGDLFSTRGFVAERHGKVLEIKLANEVTFFHKAALVKVLQKTEPGDVVHIDGSDSRRISFDVIEAIEEFRQGAPFRDVRVVVGGIEGIPAYSEEHMQELDDEYHRLIENNRSWVEEKLKEDPDYFNEMSQGQTPTFLFIGCSDSRVPAESITKTDPGKLFVHRNIANIVSHSDVNLMSVLQYSVEVLKVPHIIVCGHYGCGGVRAALGNNSLGLIDQWIIPIKTTFKLHAEEITQIKDPKQRERRVIELHVIQQVRNLLKTSIVQRTLKNFGRPKVHGWVYDLETGLINDLHVELNPKEDLLPIFQFDFNTQDDH